MYKSTIVVALLATTAVSAKTIRPSNGIPADSKAGHKLMSKARMLDQNNNQNYDDDDVTWMYKYSIKYLGCHSLLQVREDGGGEDESNLYTMNLVKFALCDDSVTCKQCGKGVAQYVVNMNDFVDAYTEMKLDAQEQACENVRENCYCDNANDDQVCENQCYTDAGMDYCVQYDGQEEFNAQEYLECRELEAGNNNNNNNYNYGNNNNNNYNNNNNVNIYQQYYVGPTCSNGFDINLAVFSDNGCSTKAKGNVYEAFNYGNSLPFEKESMVTNDCISCLQVDEDQNNNNQNNNNNNQNQDYDILELCEQSYQDAARCEKGLDGVKYYQDTSGCNYMDNILPKLEKTSRSIVNGRSMSGGSGGGAALAFAIIFGITTVLVSAYAFFLYRKIHRAKVNLSAADGELA